MVTALETDPEPCLPHQAQDQGYFVAAFVRNPYDRVLSAWANNVKEVRPGLAQLGVEKGMSFRSFVEICEERGDDDCHTRAQWKYLFHRTRFAVDFIGRFERMDEDWKRLQKMFDLPDLPHLNKSGSRKMRHHYTTELIDKVSDIYHRDLRFLGYPRM